MKKLLLLLFAAAFIFNINNSFSQDNGVVKEIIKIGKTDNQTMPLLDVLCNRIGGRPLGSDAYENASMWAAGKFREWGLEVEMDEAGTMPVGFNRGPWFGRLLGENSMELHFATPSYTAGTKGAQTGHVLMEPKTQEEFNRMKDRLKGSWVLITGKNKGLPIDYSDTSNERRNKIIAENIETAKKNKEITAENEKGGPQKELLPLKDEPALFYKQMKEAGILGIIQSAELPIRAMSDRTNIYKMKFDSLPTVCDIKLDEHQYEIIEQMVKERKNFFLEFDIRNYFRPGPIKIYSVIGIIRGTKYPDEYVMISAHLDSYDVATGAVDDGSGVTPAMEAARLIMKAGGKPKRTILFCLWAGEEFFFVGSKSWSEKNKSKLSKISDIINRDGGTNVPVNMSVSEAMWEDMQEITKPLNGINPDFPFELKKREAKPRPKKPTSNDASVFAVDGVPTMNFGCEDIKGYNFKYQEIWHTERDLYNKVISEYQEHTSIVTAIVAYGIANLNHLLSREGFYSPDKE